MQQLTTTKLQGLYFFFTMINYVKYLPLMMVDDAKTWLVDRQNRASLDDCMHQARRKNVHDRSAIVPSADQKDGGKMLYNNRTLTWYSGSCTFFYSLSKTQPSNQPKWWPSQYGIGSKTVSGSRKKNDKK